MKFLTVTICTFLGAINDNTLQSSLEEGYLAWAVTITVLLALLICATIVICKMKNNVAVVKKIDNKIFFHHLLNKRLNTLHW